MTQPATDFGRQEIRIAAVLNGGVSLAVWMSGVTLELHHLALASAGLGDWPTYARLLDRLRATARVDVIAGTSAGGLNGAFLALGLARRRDFALLRDVWADDGALDKLLRKPLAKNPPSALDGDGYFLVKIRQALSAMVGNANPELGGSGAGALPAVELMLTGTLWDGRQSRFTDDMGVDITETDHDAIFRFRSGGPTGTGELDGGDGVLAELASAARCTSSFPAAFEPHYVTVGAPAADTGWWSSSAGEANFEESQYVIDGGVLLNKPLRPALAAIYRQNAQAQVRRVLAYVVPDPGEAAPPRPPDRAGRPPVPGAPDVLLGVLTRLTSTDSVSRELSEIRDTNAAVRDHRRARARLSVAMAVAGGSLADALWGGYQSERIDAAAHAIAKLLVAGQPSGAGAWSAQELAARLTQIGSGPVGFGFVPRAGLADALASPGGEWSWGQTTVSRMVDTAADVLKRAVALAPLPDADVAGMRAALAATRARIGTIADAVQAYNADLERYWSAAGSAAERPRRVPARDPDAEGTAPGSATNVADLDRWLSGVVSGWDTAFGDDDGAARRSEQYRGALELAAELLAVRDVVAQVLAAPMTGQDPSGGDRFQLQALHAWLLPPGADGAEVLRRMLQLDVVLVATAGALRAPEQEVELVQVSCANRDSVTGMQLHHFGAFYRKSWRLNDWIEGRMDGTRQLVRVLLDPERLRQLGFTPNALHDALREVAVPLGHRDEVWLGQRWDTHAGAYREEFTKALLPGALATALDLAAEAVSMPLRLAALRADLGALADAVRDDGADAPAGSRAWLAGYDAALRHAGPKPPGTSPTAALAADQLWRLRLSMSQIGTQTLTADFGSDTFARTASHAAVVATGAFTPRATFAGLRPVRAVLSALRGYVATVFVMTTYLSRGSRIGSAAVGIAAAGGGALLAVTLFVPAVPIGLTLAGVLLLFAAATTAALRTPRIGLLAARLGAVLVLIAAGLGWLVYRDVVDSGWEGAIGSTVVKILIGVGIVSVGWFLALSHRTPPRAGAIAALDPETTRRSS